MIYETDENGDERQVLVPFSTSTGQPGAERLELGYSADAGPDDIDNDMQTQEVLGMALLRFPKCWL